MKKIIHVVGARPNFMKVAPIYRELINYKDKITQILVHTGQHYDKQMSDAFFEDLEMPYPDYFLKVGSGSHAQQTANIMLKFEEVLLNEKPDLVLVVGDVNSTLACSICSVKLNIPVTHVEAGLRSFDNEMPEEINRIITDSITKYAFVTEESGKQNLIKNGFPSNNIFFVGNTMIDSQIYALNKLEKSNILKKLNLKIKGYVLITVHRPSNVDDKIQLENIIRIFELISQEKSLVFPIHPRTKKNLINFGLWDRFNKINNMIITEPLGYIDFLSLMKNCDFVITDSGGIQEETTALSIDCITIRTTTERPITIDIGTNTRVNPNYDEMKEIVTQYLNGKRKQGRVPDLWDGKAANRIADIISNRIFFEND